MRKQPSIRQCVVLFLVVVAFLVGVSALPTAAEAQSRKSIKREFTRELRRLGWSRYQVRCAKKIVSRKENPSWNLVAWSPSHKHFGLGQVNIRAYHCCSYHWKRRKTAKCQASVMSRYVKKRYGSFSAAWRHRQTHKAY